MTFQEFSTYLDRSESVTSRTDITTILSELFSSLSDDEIAIVCYLITGRVAPLFVPVEFNVSIRTVLSVLTAVSGMFRVAMDVQREYGRMGDAGTLAESIIARATRLKKAKRQTVSLTEIYERLWGIVHVSGTGAKGLREKRILDVVTVLSPLEARYFIRIVGGQMRLGVSVKTLMDALSVAHAGDKRDRVHIEHAFGVCSDLGFVATRYMNGGVSEIEKLEVTPGTPVFPMLVEREKDLPSVFKRIPDSVVQPKFDGLRCQIHIGADPDRVYEGRIWASRYPSKDESEQATMLVSSRVGGVLLFSRNLEDMTDMFPEVVEGVERLGLKGAVLDAEVIGFNQETGEFLPFQETMVRKRKYQIGKAAAEVPVRAFVFDILYLNGESLLKKPLKDRLKLLSDVLLNTDDGIVKAENWQVDTEADLDLTFTQAISSGLEGVIVKHPDSVYRPGARGFEWIKLKRAFQGKLADSVDVVILGYYFGRGRQAQFGIGAVLGGVYDSKNEKFLTIAKIGTGITDAQWLQIKKDLDLKVSPGAPRNVLVEKMLYPDRWVYPEIVATVEADEITRSPIHTAGRGADGVGYALRFPRLKVWNRDKSPTDATSVKEVLSMYAKSRK